jgi:hypothetical protein
VRCALTPTQAEDMLRAMLRWKQTLGVERLYAEGFDFPEEAAVLKVYPHGYHRTDRLGRPVFIMLLGHIDPVQLERVCALIHTPPTPSAWVLSHRQVGSTGVHHAAGAHRPRAARARMCPHTQ